MPPDDIVIDAIDVGQEAFLDAQEQARASVDLFG